MKKTAKQKTWYKTEWDFSDMYKNLEDPLIEKDVVKIEKEYKTFALKYKNSSDYVTDDNKLLKAIKDWETLSKITSSWKPVWYLHVLVDVDSSNSSLKNKKDLLENRLTKSANEILFFEITLGKISKERQQQILKSPLFSNYSYYLERVFLTAKYNLTEPEEKILNLQSQPAYQMWVDAQRKYLTAQTVKYGSKTIPITEAMELKPTLPLVPRRKLHDEIMKKLKEISFFAEAEFAAICTNKKIRDEIRGLKTPYEATVIGYHNNMKSVEALVSTITQNFKISQNFYKLKAKLMKLKFLKAADYGVDIGKTKTAFTFEQAIDFVQKSFKEANPEFESIFNSMLSSGRIDAFPKKGKRNGAYCSGGPGVPTSILMNYIPSTNSVMTLAHEMGHALHTEYANRQPILYAGYTISVAEVASTFFENIVFEKVNASLPEKEKIWALFNRIQDDMATIFRQIAFFNFEKELHATIKEKGGMSKELLAQVYNRHISSYVGPAVKLEETDGYSFTSVPHFRYFFYVYSYAYGQLISKALYAKYRKDPTYINKVIGFLSAGSSKSPDNIFKEIGIDTTKPEFFEEGLKSIEEDIKNLEKLAKKNKLI